MDHPFERREGGDGLLQIKKKKKKKKKTGTQIWNEEQHSRVEFTLVINLIGELE